MLITRAARPETCAPGSFPKPARRPLGLGVSAVSPYPPTPACSEEVMHRVRSAGV